MLDDQEFRQAETALHILFDFPTQYRVDVLGLGSFVFCPYRHVGKETRLIPGGSVLWPEESVAYLACGFVLAMATIQGRLEGGDGL